MARQPRADIAGEIYHVINAPHARWRTFNKTSDAVAVFDALEEALDRVLWDIRTHSKKFFNPFLHPLRKGGLCPPFYPKLPTPLQQSNDYIFYFLERNCNCTSISHRAELGFSYRALTVFLSPSPYG